MSTKIINTTCTRDCPNTCGLLATVENGRLVDLKGDPAHPLTCGKACAKTRAYVDRVYSAERVTRPMVRENGEWRQVSWDHALDLIAERMQTIADESGPESILYCQGYGERTALKLLNKYFFNLFGPVTTLRGSLCGGAGQAAQNLDFGERISHDPLDHLNSRSIVLWARNPVTTNISLVPIIKKVREAGGKVVLVDPVRTRSAALADHHIQPRPGGDGYLAMAAAKLLLEAGVENRTFIDNRSEGFAEYKAVLDGFTFEGLCHRAGVPKEDAQLLAEVYRDYFPTATLLGWGLHRYRDAHHSIRPIDALGAISGNIGVPGGGVSQGFEEYGPYDQQYWGDHLHPERRTFAVSRLADELFNAEDPKVRMIFVTAGNPICMAPDTNRLAVEFYDADFVVYSGHFLDDTADSADVFLPATTFLEEDDVVATYGHNYVGPVNKTIEPVGECRSEFQMFRELARRFPFGAELDRSEDEWLELLCTPLWAQGATLEGVRKAPFRQDAPMVPYADGVFPTPSGRFRFMTKFEPETLPVDSKYPFTLLTIAPHHRICSETTVADHDAFQTVRMHPEDATRLGLRDGEIVRLNSERSVARARLIIDPGVRPGCLAGDRGGWNKAWHGFNRLMPSMTSKVGGGTPFYEVRVFVDKPTMDDVNVLVVANSEDPSGGYFCKTLERFGVQLTTVQPYKGEPLPESPDSYDGLVVLGGAQHADDDDASPYFPALLKLMRDFGAVDKPVAGLCLGAQLLARAHGATVRPMDSLEFGYVPCRYTEAGEEDPVLSRGGTMPAFMQFHEDTFDLPEGATLLATADRCANQCFRVGNKSYGFQFHLEVDSIVAGRWVREFRQGRDKAYGKYRSQFDDAFFDELEAQLPIFLEASRLFCEAVASGWYGLTLDYMDEWDA